MFDWARHGLLAGLLLLCAWSVNAIDLSGLSQQEAGSGLKETLNLASSAAVAQLGKSGGFLDNAKVRIPLPDGLKHAKKAMKLLGKEKQFDELEVSINRAAEAAVPEAKALLLNAVKSMTVEDAKAILGGGDDAVTKFFRSKTETQLAQKFLPVVKTATDKVGLAKKYNKLADQAANYGVLEKEDSKIENYVTRKALDGLFTTLAEQERAIRSDPVGTGSSLLKKIFGG